MAVNELPTHKRVQFPRNTTANVNTYIGLAGEFVFDLNRKEIRAHFGDGKPGGHRFANLNQLLTLFLGVDSEAGKLKFASNAFGFLTRISSGVYAVRELKVTDGLTITNPKGIEGSPSIGLPERIAAISGDGVAEDVPPDCNLLTLSGFYSVPATALNLPAVVLNVDAASLAVIQRSSSYVTQILLNLRADMGAWMRSMIAGAWQPWINIIPDAGTDELLEAGKDTEQRTWSAFDLEVWLTNRLQDVGSGDAGAVNSYGGSVRKANETWQGGNIGDKILGPFGIANNDRWIGYVNSTAKRTIVGTNFEDTFSGGDAVIQVELGGGWETIVNTPRGDVSWSNPRTASAFRFVWDDTNDKILVCNSDWVTTDTFNGAWTGRIRIKTNDQTQVLTLKLYRFKLKT